MERRTFASAFVRIASVLTLTCWPLQQTDALATWRLLKVSGSTRIKFHARGRDEFDEDEEMEYARVRRRGRRERPEGEFDFDSAYDAPRRRAKTAKRDTEEEEEEEFDVDAFLKEDRKERVLSRPLSLDLADPGDTISRWPELLTDRNLLRDLFIIGALIWAVDSIADIPLMYPDPDII